VPLLILAGATLLSLGVSGMIFTGLSLIVDATQKVIHQRLSRPEFWRGAAPEAYTTIACIEERVGNNGYGNNRAN
jgi:hypothetical protein